MPNVIFLGQFYPHNILTTIKEDTHGHIGFSNHNFEMSLLNGFSHVEGINLKVISTPMTFSYPHNNKRAFIRAEHYTENDSDISSIGFCNIAVINQFSKYYFLKRKIRSAIRSFNGEPVNIIVNTPSLILSKALFDAIANLKCKITTTLIVPDVPECLAEMGHSKSIKHKLIIYLNRLNARLSQRYDKYVYLTDAMNDFYHAKPNDYIVIEGLIDDSRVCNANAISNNECDKEIILYTGTLTRLFGIMDLVNMFDSAGLPNCELWICGSGECATEIEEKARVNPNIKFYGLVDSAEALRLQSQATILANPRSANGNYTKYSFPSKTIEYLLAGKTVIMNRLPGIPTEYDNFIHYPVDESSEAWTDKLNEIITMDRTDRRQKDEAGRKFIIDNKLASIQCSRIVELAHL